MNTTNIRALGLNEVYIEWFECAECKCREIYFEAKYCPKCGRKIVSNLSLFVEYFWALKHNIDKNTFRKTRWECEQEEYIADSPRKDKVDYLPYRRGVKICTIEISITADNVKDAKKKFEDILIENAIFLEDV